MTNSIKRSANNFLREYGARGLSAPRLREIIISQGYRIIGYNKLYNNENTEFLINSLGVEGYIRAYSAFTYTDDRYRIVFIENRLSEREELILLAHEEGHIYLHHLGADAAAGKSITDEFEANEFAHYILKPGGSAVLKYVRAHKTMSVFAGVVLCLTIAASIAVPAALSGVKYRGEYYVTPSGEKYHEKSCYYIKGKSGIRRVTKEEMESGEYEPCRVCLPELADD